MHEENKEALTTILLKGEGQSSKRLVSNEKESEGSTQKMKPALPASFYRIKLQNHHKNKKRIPSIKEPATNSSE